MEPINKNEQKPARLTVSFNDKLKRQTFFGVACRINQHISICDDLPAYAEDVSRLFRKYMKEAETLETKHYLTQTLTSVIETLASPYKNSRGLSNTAATITITEAIEKLSSALFKNADASMIPDNLPQKLAQRASELEQSAAYQEYCVKSVIQEQAGVLLAITKKIDDLKSPSAHQKGNGLAAKMSKMVCNWRK